MHVSTRRSDPGAGLVGKAGGFTLIELLVVIAILALLADNEDGWWRSIVRERLDWGPSRSEFDVWNAQHLPTGPEGQRRVAGARHRDGCNAAFLDGHCEWTSAEKMTEEMWRPQQVTTSEQNDKVRIDHGPDELSSGP